jgi:uncharacterized protein
MKRFFKVIFYITLILFVCFNVVVNFHAYKFTHFYEMGSQNYPVNSKSLSGWQKTKMLLFGVNAEKRVDATPDTTAQNITIKTADGITLAGWYGKVPNAKGTVIMLHGHGGFKSNDSQESTVFRSLGYNTLQIDFRAHGQSSGNICTIGFNETIDVKAAYDYVAAQGEKNIVLWGISMGAATVLKTINDYPSVQPKKVIVEMPFASLMHAVKSRIKMFNLPEQPFAGALCFWGSVQQRFWGFGFKPSEYAKKVNTPILLQWGKADNRVSLAEQNAIFENIATKNKTFVTYPNAGHQSLCGADKTKWTNAVATILAQ